MEKKSNVARLNEIAFAHFFQTSLKSFVFYLAFLTGLGMNLGLAQTFSEIDIAQFELTIVSPDIILNAGESAEILVHVGTPLKIVSNAVGFKLDIELSPDARLESSINPRIDGWFGISSSKILETQITGSPKDYKLEYSKDLPSTGFGKIIKFIVVANTNQIHASRLVKNVGGIMIIDNLDARYGQFSSNDAKETKAYPNPGNGHLKLSGNTDNISKIKVMSSNGTELASFSENQQLDISQLKSGCYFLQYQYHDGSSKIEKYFLH